LIADGPYDLRAVVTDATGNVADTLLPGLPKTVDNTAPTGSVAAPVAGAYVSGPVAVDASASDGAVPPASGVSAVRFEVKAAGAGAYSVFGTQTAPVVGATYRQTLATTSLADGPADLRVVVTDVAGNEITSTTRTINVDNDAPVVTLADPGAAIGASVALAASSSADTADVTFRYRPVGNLGAGTSIGSDTSTPFGVTWSTSPTAEQQWELIAVATDTGGNVTTSAPRVVLVDRTQPSVVVTAPAAAATVGGPAVALAVNADDSGGSGVALVEWQVQEVGAPSFTTVSSDAAAPYDGTWDSTSAPDGPAAVRARVTDAAGNVRISAAVTVTVDSSGPSATLSSPAASRSAPPPAAGPSASSSPSAPPMQARGRRSATTRARRSRSRSTRPRSSTAFTTCARSGSTGSGIRRRERCSRTCAWTTPRRSFSPRHRPTARCRHPRTRSRSRLRSR
jgi:large repetitive protein